MTMIRFSIRTINTNKICYLFCIVITFFLAIFKKEIDFLYFSLIKVTSFDKRPLSDSEFSFTSFIAFNAYNKKDTMSSILYFVDKDILVSAIWPCISKKIVKIINAQNQ